MAFKMGIPLTATNCNESIKLQNKLCRKEQLASQPASGTSNKDELFQTDSDGKRFIIRNKLSKAHQ